MLTRQEMLALVEKALSTAAQRAGWEISRVGIAGLPDPLLNRTRHLAHHFFNRGHNLQEVTSTLVRVMGHPHLPREFAPRVWQTDEAIALAREAHGLGLGHGWETWLGGEILAEGGRGDPLVVKFTAKDASADYLPVVSYFLARGWIHYWSEHPPGSDLVVHLYADRIVLRLLDLVFI